MTPCAAVLLDDEAVVVRFSSAPDTVEAVSEILAGVGKVGEPRIRPVLWDVRRWPSGWPATWIRLVSTVPQLFSAAALLHERSSPPKIHESSTMTLGAVPFRSFTLEPEARAFLYARTRSTEDRSSALVDKSAVFETMATTIWFEDGILFVRSKHVTSTIETAVESLAVMAQLVGDEPRPVLWDARDWRGTAPLAWLKLISVVRSLATAVAMVLGPDNAGLAGSFPAAINQLLVPFRLFTDPDEALAYLHAQKGP